MSLPIEYRIPALVESIKDRFAQGEITDDTVSREIRKVVSLLEPLPPLTGRFHTCSHPAIRHIKAITQTGNASMNALLDEILPVTPFLPWHYNYPLRENLPDLGQDIAFAEIVGPEAPFRSDSVCLGLTLIGKETLYPAHYHPAIELYYVVAGTATWTLNESSQSYPPGSCILHPSMSIHAMETQDEPLLAIYTWSGPDIRTSSSYTNSYRGASRRERCARIREE
jgi:mannose-6-phosphate isomerase-like protein (cupin superfamily)